MHFLHLLHHLHHAEDKPSRHGINALIIFSCRVMEDSTFTPLHLIFMNSLFIPISAVNKSVICVFFYYDGTIP